MLAITYLALVWTLSALIRYARGVRARVAGGLAMSLPDWVEPVAHYIIFEGLPGTLKISAGAVSGSIVIGVTLGTLITIRFWPLRTLIRLYIEIWRGLPILVTVFMICIGLPIPVPGDRARGADVRDDRARALGECAGRRGDARRRPVDSARAARGGSGARLRLARASRARDPAASAAAAACPRFVSLLVNIIQNSTLAQVIGGLELLRRRSARTSG